MERRNAVLKRHLMPPKMNEISHFVENGDNMPRERAKPRRAPGGCSWRMLLWWCNEGSSVQRMRAAKRGSGRLRVFITGLELESQRACDDKGFNRVKRMIRGQIKIRVRRATASATYKSGPLFPLQSACILLRVGRMVAPSQPSSSLSVAPSFPENSFILCHCTYLHSPLFRTRSIDLDWTSGAGEQCTKFSKWCVATPRSW